MKIEKTTNYDKFRTIKGNRELNRTYLNKLTRSVEENNLLEANPIIVNERFQVLDGQHRLEVARRLEIPIFYVIVPTGSIKEIQMLNSNVRGWTMLNFLDSYIDRGNENYMLLKGFMEMTGLSLGIGILLLTGAQSRSRNGHKIIEDFKNGDFKITQAAFADRVAKDLGILSEFCEVGVCTDREFVAALTLAYSKGFRFEAILGKLKSSSIKLIFSKTRKGYIRQLEDVLSFKAKAPARII